MYDVGWPICIDMFYENAPEFALCVVGTTVGPTPLQISDILYKSIRIRHVAQFENSTVMFEFGFDMHY